MNISNREIKLRFIEELYNNFDVKKAGNEFRIRCPFCGDSSTDPKKKRLYIKINTEDNYPMVYNCFNCNETGFINESVLDVFGMNFEPMVSYINKLNKSTDKVDKKGIYLSKNDYITYFDFKIPPLKRGYKTKYIEDRLEVPFSDDDYKDMKVITSLYDFLRINEINNSFYPKYYLDNFENHYVGFLSSGNSYILLRDVSGKEKNKWVKYPILKESRDCKCIYTCKSGGDVYTKENFIINLAEGVFDILGVIYNIGFQDSNCMNISIGGKDYRSIFIYLLSLGVVGSNVTVNIFADNDKEFNPNARYPTTIEWFKNNLNVYKHLYGSVNIYYNKKNKDFGYPKEDIVYQKYRL